ncbi:MAG: hypothetical protein FJY37_07345 [Betaproteobacteria bacterium]|nr:hypothetical protein [Betaproteobacteria bacterium]
MDNKALGASGPRIAPLIFGDNVLGWTADEATSFTLLDAFVAAGFQCIDTADVYSRWVPGHQGGEYREDRQDLRVWRLGRCASGAGENQALSVPTRCTGRGRRSHPSSPSLYLQSPTVCHIHRDSTTESQSPSLYADHRSAAHHSQELPLAPDACLRQRGMGRGAGDG